MNQLTPPPLLAELINTGRWKQPSDKTIEQVIPFLQEPVDFLLNLDEMRRESSGFLADDSHMSELFHEYRGGKTSERDLPWLDVDKALFIAVNRVAGADIGIALDYRTNTIDPRVVASDWWSGDTIHYWREVENNFSVFVKKIGL
ncbi:MAG: hypothetical protein JNM55_22085 [Anaerolineales bacterium]|nr:hypothetical protein [Anaerolineales bacterium]